MPAEVFELDLKKALNRALKHVPNFTQRVNDDNIQKFIQKNPTLPKVLFFSDKSRTPLVLKALSSSFKGKLGFGLVVQDPKKPEEHSNLPSEYRIKKFPSMIVIRP
jgi:hypothetical protein